MQVGQSAGRKDGDEKRIPVIFAESSYLDWVGATVEQAEQLMHLPMPSELVWIESLVISTDHLSARGFNAALRLLSRLLVSRRLDVALADEFAVYVVS